MNEKNSALSRDQAYYFEKLKKGERMYIAIPVMLLCLWLLDMYLPWTAMWENLGPFFWLTTVHITVFSVVADSYGKKLYNSLNNGESREICRRYADCRKKRYLAYSAVPCILLVLWFVGMVSDGALYDFYKKYLGDSIIMFGAFAGGGFGLANSTKLIYEIIDIFTE